MREEFFGVVGEDCLSLDWSGRVPQPPKNFERMSLSEEQQNPINKEKAGLHTFLFINIKMKLR